MRTYKYGMRLRGFSIGCQPMDGLIRREDDPKGKYHDILIYDRILTSAEITYYELDYISFESTAEIYEGITDNYRCKVVSDAIKDMESDDFCLTRLQGDKGKAINIDTDLLKIIKGYFEGKTIMIGE